MTIWALQATWDDAAGDAETAEYYSRLADAVCEILQQWEPAA